MILTKMKVLVSGGTGLVGSELCALLRQNGHEVRTLSRRQSNDSSVYVWNVENGTIDKSAFEGIDAIVHLAGAGIADKPWSSSRKKVLRDSRIKSAELLYETCVETGNHPKVFIGSSAIGFYPDSGDRLLTEQSKSGDSYICKLCQDWENSQLKFERIGSRVVINRVSIVLSRSGGALEKMMKTTALKLISYLGDGMQWNPWIHIEDLARLIQFEIENEQIQGIFNACTNQSVRQKELVKTLSRVCGPFLVTPAPAFVIKLAMGEMSQVVLGSQKCSSEKLLGTAFKFKYAELEPALTELFAD